MPTLKITGFSGPAPRVAPRLLPDGAAQQANNMRLTSGELTPYRSPRLIYAQAKAKPAKSIYRAVNGDTATWLTWPEEVDVVRAPFEASVEPRFYWTGEGIPRYATYSQATAGGGNDYPHTSFALGIPSPTAMPSVVPTGGTGATVSRFYCHTFYNPGTGEESGQSPVSEMATGKVDGSWSISGMSPLPANTGNVSAAVADIPTVGHVRVTTDAPHWLRTGEQISISGVLGMADLNGSHSVTVLAPNQFSVPVATTQSYASGGTWSRAVAWNTTGMVRRIYRTSGSLATFQLVAETPNTAYTDMLSDLLIPGDDLISAGWLPPPVGLTGLRITPFGSAVGFVGNLVCLSVPGQPHAWPVEYQFSTLFPVKALGMAGSDIVVATSANPYVLTGLDPSAMALQKLNGIYPCLHKRSLVSDGSTCYYASSAGIVAVANGQPSVITGNWYTSVEWAPLVKTSMMCEIWNSRLVAAYVDGSGNRQMLIFDFANGHLEPLSVAAHDLYTDETTGILYLSTDQGVEEFDHEMGAPLLGEYWTKEFVFPTPCNLGAAQVLFISGLTDAEIEAIAAARDAAIGANHLLFQAGKVFGGYDRLAYGRYAFNRSNAMRIPDLPAYSTCTFTLYSKGAPVFSRTVMTTEGFRLPAGFKTDRVSVRINAQSRVAYIILAETMTGLKQA